MMTTQRSLVLMATRLAAHFSERRLFLGLRPGKVAKLLGYTSLVGAANKIVHFEETGDVDFRFFKKLATVIGVERATILRLMEQDRRELVAQWTEWANQRVAPHLIARLLPGYFMSHPIPDDLTTLDEMEMRASELASDLRQEVFKHFFIRRRGIRRSEEFEQRTGPTHRSMAGRPGCVSQDTRRTRRETRRVVERCPSSLNLAPHNTSTLTTLFNTRGGCVY